MDFVLPRYLVATFGCVLALACKTQEKNPASTNLSEQCKASAAYSWSEGKCQLRTALAMQEQKKSCEQQGADYVWLNDKCIQKAEVTSPRERCTARGDGSYWQINPATREGSCVSAATAGNQKEDCATKIDQGYKWQDGQCLSPEAQACLLGGDYWLNAFGCMNPAQKACFDLQDGSRWGGDRCLSSDELACQERGYHYRWVSKPDGGYCSAKQFEDYCLDGSVAPADIQQTVHELLQTSGFTASSCSDAALKLNALQALDLDGRSLTRLEPLTGFRNLVRLNLQDNAISSLEPIEGLEKLEELDLTSNKVEKLESLARLTRLKVLYLSYNQIRNPAPLGTLPVLQRLYLAHNQITSLADMIRGDTTGGLSQLQQLELQENCHLSDGAPLVKLAALKYVTLRKTGIKTLPPFSPSVQIDLAPCP